MKRLLIATNPKPSDNYFNRLWQNERAETPSPFKPKVILWYERAEFEIPKTEAKRVYEPSKEELSKWGL